MSHPSWVCGLKPEQQHDIVCRSESHPSWVCGLKLFNLLRHNIVKTVTPFVGVWIETLSLQKSQENVNVTPFVGVWIETGGEPTPPPSGKVTPFVGVWIETRKTLALRGKILVTPFVGVWIETLWALTKSYCLKSHPSWVCGLKLREWRSHFLSSLSHPSWVCGLKRKRDRVMWRTPGVTPFVGVWIETINPLTHPRINASHPSWVCGLKHWWHRG